MYTIRPLFSDFSYSERIFSFPYRYTSDFVLQNEFILIEGFTLDIPFAKSYASFASAFTKWRFSAVKSIIALTPCRK